MREKKYDSVLLPETLEEVNINSIISEIEIDKKRELNPIQVFISYAKPDYDFKKQLTKHISSLIRLNKITIWDKDMVSPGQVWELETQSKLRDSDIILCLISSDFIYSDFCYSKELKDSIEFHNKDMKVVIPILIRPCHWEGLPIHKLKWVPNNAISTSENKDEKWAEVVKSIDIIINSINNKKYGTQQ